MSGKTTMPWARWAIIPNAQLPPIIEPSMAAMSIVRPVIAGATKYIIEVSNTVPMAPPTIARPILIMACSSLGRRLPSPHPSSTEPAPALASTQRNAKSVVERRNVGHAGAVERRAWDTDVGEHEVTDFLRHESALG